MIYITLILLCMSLILIANAFGGADVAMTLYHVTVLTAAVIAVDGIGAYLLRRLPERVVRYEGRLFAVTKGELAFYRHIGIKHWKRIVPDLGCFTQFPKEHLSDPHEADYTSRYLLEAAYGIIIHAVNVPTGFLILLIFPEVALTVALPVALVNAVLSALPLFVLRSNFPALVRLHRHNLRRTANAVA